MLLALKIILVIALVGFAVVVIAVWWFINRVKSALKEVLSGLTIAPPCRITLQPDSHPEWRFPAVIKQYSDDFTTNGFTPVGTFGIPELENTRIAAFVNETENLFGVIYDHEKLPPNFDVVCRYEDGTDLTVTNTTYADAMDRPPHSPAIRLEQPVIHDAETDPIQPKLADPNQPKIGVREAMDAAWKHPASAPRLAARGADFVSRFESAYAQEMNWRMSRGGITREEVRRQAEKNGKKLSEEELVEVCEKQRSAWMTQLQIANVNQYKTDQNIAPAEWKKTEYRVFAIPSVFTEEEVYEQLEVNLGLEEKQMAELRKIKLAPGETALDLMNQVLAGKAGQLPMKRLGSVKEPVPAEILLSEVPEDDSDESDDEESDESDDEAQQKA